MKIKPQVLNVDVGTQHGNKWKASIHSTLQMTDNEGGLVCSTFPAVEVRASTHAAALWTNWCRQKFPQVRSLRTEQFVSFLFICVPFDFSK